MFYMNLSVFIVRFYDGVREVGESEEALMDALPFSAAEYSRGLGVARLSTGTPRDTLMCDRDIYINTQIY